MFCKFSKLCHPVILSSLIPHDIGKEEMSFNFSAQIPDQFKNIVEFYPKDNSKLVKNGKNINNLYYAKNLTGNTIIIKTKFKVNCH